MRELLVNEKQLGKRIDKLIREAFPHMPVSAIFKAFRKRDIKVNGIRVKDDYIVSPGDKLEIFIIDRILDGVIDTDSNKPDKSLEIAYEDSNLLIVNKAQGIPVHPDRDQLDNTLIDLVKEYLREKGEYSPDSPLSYTPNLCHRLDRNTGGLVIIAKNNESLKIILEKMKSNEIKKYYQCLVHGKMEKPSGVLRAYLEKDEKKSRVFIKEYKTKDSLEIITHYKLLSYENNISRLEVELLTGRTHQIRAHLAYTGHPIIGDGKYGTNAINRAAGAKFQALWAYKLVFDFKTDARFLNYLKGKKIDVKPAF